MKAYKGVFSANGTTGNQTVSGIVDEGGNAFTPKAIMLWTTYQSSAGFSDALLFQIGFADGTSQNSCCVAATDNASPNDTNRTRSTSAVCEVRDAGGSVLRRGEFVSFASGEFTINWTAADGATPQISFLALGGDDLEAWVGATNADWDFTSVPFVPTTMLIAHCVSDGDLGNLPAFGWYAITEDGEVTQGAACTGTEDNQTTSDCRRYQRTDRCTNILSSTMGLFNDYARDAVGLSAINRGGNAAVFLHCLALGGIAAKAGHGTQPTSTGTQAVTGVGFSPKAVLTLTVGDTPHTTVQTECRFSLGAADRSRQGWEWVGNANGVNPSVAAGGHSASAVMVAADPDATGSSTSADAEAAMSSMDSDGFTLNWSTADATARQYLWLALGDATSSSGGGGAFAYAFMG